MSVVTGFSIARGLDQRGRHGKTHGPRLSAMLAPWPAAGTALACTQVFATPPDALLARLGLFRVLDPANPFVAGEGGDVVPGRKRRLIRFQRGLEIRREIVDNAAGKRGHA